jgi:hypothetical protein
MEGRASNPYKSSPKSYLVHTICHGFSVKESSEENRQDLRVHIACIRHRNKTRNLNVQLDSASGMTAGFP